MATNMYFNLFYLCRDSIFFSFRFVLTQASKLCKVCISLVGYVVL